MTNSKRKKILLAVDGSEQAMEAVRYVSKILPPDQMEINLFNVMTKIPESFWDLQKEPAFYHRIANIKAWEMQQENIINVFMENARQLLLSAGFPDDSFTLTIHERQDGIARDIYAESRKDYSAVVLGRTGLSDLKDLILGSIANKLMERLSHVPIWIIGGSPQPGKLLICMDTSEWAMKGIDYVGSMLDGSESEVLLFHAVRGFDIFQRSHGKSFVPEHNKDWLEQAEKELNEAGSAIEPAFEEAKQRLVNAGLSKDRISTRVVTGVASRAGAIIAEAQQGGFDTVVVGRRGLSKVQEFFMGRVSNKIIQMARELAVWVVS